jgi:hypothetical protein
MSVIPAPERLRQKDQEFKTILDYIQRACLTCFGRGTGRSTTQAEEVRQDFRGTSLGPGPSQC